MPVLLLVRQVLGVDADGLGALLAGVGEHLLVALHAVGVLITQHVSLAGQRVVALPAAEVARVPVLVHGLGVLAREHEIEMADVRLLRRASLGRRRTKAQERAGRWCFGQVIPQNANRRFESYTRPQRTRAPKKFAPMQATEVN